MVMILPTEALAIMAILLLNFAIITRLKNGISLILSSIIINLILILLFSMRVPNFEILHNIVIAIIIFSGVIFTLFFSLFKIKSTPKNTNFHDQSRFFENKIHSALFFTGTLIVSLAIFYLTFQTAGQNKKQIKPDQIMQMIDPAKVAEKKPDQPDLKNNVILKNSTDAILIICGLMMAIFLVRKNQHQEEGKS